MTDQRKPIPGYTYFGLAVIFTAEILLLQGDRVVATFFTPIVWTGYILLMDGLVFRLKGSSLLNGRLREFFFLLPTSITLWLVFELYNFPLKNWTYINLPEILWQRWIGYAWAFATILPAIFETAEWLEGMGLFSRFRVKPIPISTGFLRGTAVAGALCAFLPLLAPPAIAPYLFGFVWVGYALMLDPVNYFSGVPSLFRDLQEGKLERLAGYFTAGLICGLLWEFWNYWATAKWVYTVPIMQNYKLFEMPLIGYLGFPAFALECFVITVFVKRWWGFKA